MKNVNRSKGRLQCGAHVSSSLSSAVRLAANLHPLPMSKKIVRKIEDAAGRVERDDKGKVIGVSQTAYLSLDDLVSLKDLKHLKSFALSDPITDEDMAHVAALTNLEDLDLTSVSLGDAGLAHLAKLTSLKILRLHAVGGKITDEGLRFLSALTNLEELELGGLSRVEGPGLSHLKNLRNLKSLHLSIPGIEQDLLKHIRTLQRLRHLKAGIEVKDADLANLSGLRELESLELHSRVSDVGLLHLESLGKLRSLRLSFLDVRTGLAPLSKLEQLEELSLGIETMNDEHLAALKHLPKLAWLYCSVRDASAVGQIKSLKSLVLTFSGTAPKTGRLVGIGQLNNLEELTIVCHPGSDFTSQELACLKPLSKLRTLRLNTRTSDDTLAELAKLKQLVEIELNGQNDITDAGLASLKALPHLRHLQIALDGSPITDVGLAHIGELKELTGLELRGKAKSVGDAGIAHLHGLSKLQKLNLSRLDIGDSSLVHLRNLRNLRELDLATTAITDKGLGNLAGLSQLQRLNVNLTRVTLAGIVKHLHSLKQIEELDFAARHLSPGIRVEDAKLLRTTFPRLKD